jgi:hypothetical protein
MPKICYEPKTFKSYHEGIIQIANEIIAEYAQAGFALTLRQLFYQFVARDYLPNQQKYYKLLGGVINDARLAGRIDWNAIEDRTRNLRSNPHWESPAQIVQAAAEQYEIDKWANQDKRIECWIEKDALVGVIEDVCRRWDVPFFSCRGYVSQSEQWRAAMRYEQYASDGQDMILLHLGDHDPSGIDMTRDIEHRMQSVFGVHCFVERLALNMDQIKHYSPPPNPAKVTDSRAPEYIARYGRDSWELDALDPRTIESLIEDAISAHVDLDRWQESVDIEDDHKESLQTICRQL